MTKNYCLQVDTKYIFSKLYRLIFIARGLFVYCFGTVAQLVGKTNSIASVVLPSIDWTSRDYSVARWIITNYSIPKTDLHPTNAKQGIQRNGSYSSSKTGT